MAANKHSWEDSRSCFGIGPGAGHLIADIVGGAEPLVDPRPYHPDRFLSSAWGKVADF
jgi:glycine/D-amino acid oxidase-like deaminating enzyme